jgi:hypothetical protein
MLKMCNDVLLVGPSTYLNRLMNHNDAASQWCFFLLLLLFFPLKYYWPLDYVRETSSYFLNFKKFYNRYQNKKKKKEEEDSVQIKKKKTSLQCITICKFDFKLL